MAVMMALTFACLCTSRSGTHASTGALLVRKIMQLEDVFFKADVCQAAVFIVKYIGPFTPTEADCELS